ncbi:DEAD/DEAH box helicase [Biformimicrobium ophioploci]|uniref:ATP-dependent RNA helicase RhlE n=1 Tax=Biformimicrobium ophioploci TaxID=3036711 RepID=A0ABQ6LXG0_9GAMM|nr:DEAD/DEAH box helicase [Microbulbifer sp. NKW57]GMG86751.1 DEAD/DEAH box helicase [Microbulbifer sp. NKW57]
MSFEALGLSAPILKAVAAQGYETPSPIQAKSIAPVIAGRDLMAAAQTGTGKTAGFTLPILEKLSNAKPVGARQARVLVLTPTRELAAQVGESVQTYSRYMKRIKSTVVFGGVKINPQIAHLRGGVDVLVATPGRLLDLYNQGAVKFDELEILVLDEADRMLDMGFIHDIKKILRILPKQRQNLLFSATFSDEIRALAKGLVNDPLEISVTPRNSTAKTVKQWICPVDKSRKPHLLCNLIHEHQWHQVLVFTRTKHGANRLTKQLEADGIRAAAIHGNKSQNARTKALAEFKSGKIGVLVATDIAARGIDIDQLPQVVNFDLPNVPEDYVHRIGRTGRAGADGQAVSLVSADEIKQLAAIERLINQQLTRKEIEGFEPDHALPESRGQRGNPQRKPQQNRGNGNRNENRNSEGRNGNGGKSAGNGQQRRGTSQARGAQSGNDRNDPNGNRAGQRRRRPSGNRSRQPA